MGKEQNKNTLYAIRSLTKYYIKIAFRPIKKTIEQRVHFSPRDRWKQFLEEYKGTRKNERYKVKKKMNIKEKKNLTKRGKKQKKKKENNPNTMTMDPCIDMLDMLLNGNMIKFLIVTGYGCYFGLRKISHNTCFI